MVNNQMFRFACFKSLFRLSLNLSNNTSLKSGVSAFLFILIFFGMMNLTVYSDTFERAILSSDDDAEENLADGSIDVGSSDLELLTDEDPDPSKYQAVGLRFTNVTIPAGAVINDAWVMFTAKDGSSEDVDLNIYGEKTDNPVSFTTGTNDISNRTKTGSVVAWNITSRWDSEGTYKTSNFKTVLQEIVDTSSWSSGNAVVIILAEGPTTNNQQRAWSFDGKSESAPVLQVDYTVATGTQFTLDTTASNGSISLSPSSATFDSGIVVTVTAVPDAGYQFVNWTGALTDSTSPGSVTMDTSKSLTAVFSALPVGQHTLTFTSEHGTIVLDPTGGVYDSGTTVELTVQAGTNYTFSSWSGDLSGSTNPETITMDANKTITAEYTQIAVGVYSLTATGENGSIKLNPEGGIYAGGTDVILTATPSEGYVFQKWSGGVFSSANPLTVTIGKVDIDLVAIFGEPVSILPKMKKLITALPAMTTGMLDLASTIQFDGLAVYTLFGKRLMYHTYSEARDGVDLQHLEQGHYILHFFVGKEIISKSILKYNY
jgi:hypothetical protein